MSMFVFNLIFHSVFCQPLYAAVETWVAKRCPNFKILVHDHLMSDKNLGCSINIFGLLSRSAFVLICTFLTMLMPFFNDVFAFLGADGFFSPSLGKKRKRNPETNIAAMPVNGMFSNEGSNPIYRIICLPKNMPRRKSVKEASVLCLTAVVRAVTWVSCLSLVLSVFVLLS